MLGSRLREREAHSDLSYRLSPVVQSASRSLIKPHISAEVSELADEPD